MRQREVRLAADHIPETVLAPLPRLVKAIVSAPGAVDLGGIRRVLPSSTWRPRLGQAQCPYQGHQGDEDADGADEQLPLEVADDTKTAPLRISAKPTQREMVM